MKPQASIATRKIYTIVAASALVISVCIVPIYLFLLVNEGGSKTTPARPARYRPVVKKAPAKKETPPPKRPLYAVKGYLPDAGPMVSPTSSDYSDVNFDAGDPTSTALARYGIVPVPPFILPKRRAAPRKRRVVPRRRKPVAKKSPTSRPMPAQIKAKVVSNRKVIQKKLKQVQDLEKSLRRIKERLEVFAKQSTKPRYYKYLVRTCKHYGKRKYCRWRRVRIRRSRRPSPRRR